MITTSKFSEAAKVFKGIAAVYSVQCDSSFIESDMKIDIDTIRKEFANCNGKKYRFAHFWKMAILLLCSLLYLITIQRYGISRK